MAIHKRKLNKSLVWFSVLFSVSLVVPLVGQAAVLYLEPENGQYYQGDTFIINLKVNTEGEEINTVEGNLKFSRDLLKFIDFIKGDSILSLWVQEPAYFKEEGKISFLGGIPDGFRGDGKILSIVLQTISLGEAKISFQDISKVLLNDGKGTPAQLSFSEGNYQITERPKELPEIFSRSHPDQNKWYQNKTLHLHWDLIEGTEYSFLLSYNPLAEPDEIPDRPEGELIWMGDIEYANLEDGIYYFTLKQKLPDQNWSKTATFRAMIDATSPEDFKPEIAKIEGKNYLVFTTIDKTSGIDHYEAKELSRIFPKNNKKEWKLATSPYLLENQSLRTIIKIKAVDKAGNEKISEIAPPFKITWKDIIISLVILIVIAVIWLIIQRFKKKRKIIEIGPR